METGLGPSAPTADTPRHPALNVILVSARRIRSLNREFLGRDDLTDVIAFDLRRTAAPAGGGEAPADTPVAAEVYVCVDVATEAARRYSTTPAYEVLLYAVHGMLHLTGLDDHTPADRRRMRAAERRIMDRLDAAPPPGSRRNRAERARTPRRPSPRKDTDRPC